MVGWKTRKVLAYVKESSVELMDYLKIYVDLQSQSAPNKEFLLSVNK